jgi:hypothetical protein
MGKQKSKDHQELGPLASAAESRPKNYAQLPTAEQWRIDKMLGILDWDGDPKK